MCFSFEISLLTGIFSWSVAFYLLKKPLTTIQRQNVIMLLIFSSVQFADAILWYIKMKKNNVNYVVTSLIIPIILSLQIIYNIYVINNINNTYVNIIIFILVIYVFVLIDRNEFTCLDVILKKFFPIFFDKMYLSLISLNSNSIISPIFLTKAPVIVCL